MADVVDICNQALGRVGHTQLIAALEDSTNEAQQAALHFETRRDEVLVAYPWPFATRRAVLAQVLDGAGEPLARTDWGYVYALPADCFHVQGLVLPGDRNPPVANRYPFRIEAGEADGTSVLLTDLKDAELVYTARRAVATAWPPDFVDALTWRLAVEFALALRKDPGAGAMALRAYKLALQRAAARAFNQSQPDAPPTPRAVTARR